MKRPVVVLQHGAMTPPGWLEDVLAEQGVDYRVVGLHAGEPLPDHRACSALVSLGGVMGAYDEDRYPFLSEEKRLLRRATDDGVPVLGICLGSQLLAEALGGRAFRGPKMEAGFFPIQVRPEGQDDPVLRRLADPVLSFHGDTWEPPPGAVVLAESERYPQAFRAGPALGLQFHVESPAAIVERWVAAAGKPLRDAGVDAEALTAQVRALDGQVRRRAWEIFGAWLDEVRTSSTAGGRTGRKKGRGVSDGGDHQGRRP